MGSAHFPVYCYTTYSQVLEGKHHKWELRVVHLINCCDTCHKQPWIKYASDYVSVCVCVGWSVAKTARKRFTYHQKSPAHQIVSHFETSPRRCLWCNLQIHKIHPNPKICNGMQYKVYTKYTHTHILMHSYTQGSWTCDHTALYKSMTVRFCINLHLQHTYNLW